MRRAVSAFALLTAVSTFLPHHPVRGQHRALDSLSSVRFTRSETCAKVLRAVLRATNRGAARHTRPLFTATKPSSTTAAARAPPETGAAANSVALQALQPEPLLVARFSLYDPAARAFARLNNDPLNALSATAATPADASEFFICDDSCLECGARLGGGLIWAEPSPGCSLSAIGIGIGSAATTAATAVTGFNGSFFLR